MSQSIEGKDKEQRDNEAYSKGFARIPNMLFASYKYLSKEEKFLYCTLKSVYWDAKPRFVSLRDLGDLVGFSPGALSKMLPRLTTCGLINAEIKRERGKDGKEKGNPKYNITILDIWELNRRYLSCSPNERDLLDPSLELVHENTQACSPNDTSLLPKTHKTVHQMNKFTHVEKPVKPSKTTPKERIKTSLKTSLKKESMLPPSPGADEKDSSTLSFTPDESLLISWIKELRIRKPKDDEKVREYVCALAPHVKSKEALKSLFDFTKEQIQQSTLKVKTTFLGNLVDYLDEWEKQHAHNGLSDSNLGGLLVEDIALQRLTLEWRDELVVSIHVDIPELVMYPVDFGDGFYGLDIAESENEYIQIGCLQDWNHLPRERVMRAIEYGRAYWAAQQQKEKESVA